ncbi:SDR family oxidoreductase [Mesorhizobium sp. M0012]|uniref:SDR family NAD(P)-dependent oxidoreductase n=1 Tax=Mesorhizobium sp. M0012 TaxID=2956840 RepID=UPI00333AA8B3
MQQKHSRRNSACYPSLKGKVIFITGGCSGLGAAMIQGFSWQGARVAFVDIKKSLSEALVTSLSEHVYPPVFIECDIRNIAALQMTIERVGRDLGDVSVLINYVANDTRDNRMAINLRPMFFATQAVIPQMKRLGGGSIINFGSLSARTASIIPTYMTAKAGAHGLTTGLARELGPFNIRVNTLLPGWVMKERQRREHLTLQGEARIDALQSVRVHVQPDDIAGLALFLASDDGALCSSQEFVIDAEWTP